MGSSTDAPSSSERGVDSFPIVGVGASAGGLEAFTQLLKLLPDDSGMAFVLIQHSDTTHPARLGETLAKATRMNVSQVDDGVAVEPNHVYVIPPSADVTMLHGRLALVPRKPSDRRPHLSIDHFLRSLAADRGGQAIGVVLSGNASDGTEGLRAIKAEHGITFAQTPATARFAKMPRSAVQAGVVDCALPIPELAQELVRLSAHPYVAAQEVPLVTGDADLLAQILAVVRDVIGVDFAEYKGPTLERRLARRMALRRAKSPRHYLTLLQQDREEVRALVEDILIHVTSFFRDREVFAALASQILPDIVRMKPPGEPIRVWVAGCSTGEEAYSIAILLREVLGDSPRPVQIFGSDLSETSIAKARMGVYPVSALRDVSDERRRRFFVKTDRGFRISKTVSDLCVFVQHDLARDLPFSKLDLVSCRNVLIYFDQALQKRILPTFHYSLNRPGYLLLGRTEGISGFDPLFQVVDRANKIFARTPLPSVLQFSPRYEARVADPPAQDVHPPQIEHDLIATKEYLQSLVEEHGRTNDALGTANEALQSSNDELRTAKEALQSSNDALKLHVTQAQQARAEAEHANAAKDVFLAVLGHELRTPLSSLLLHAQRLRRGIAMDTAKLIRVGESIERATRMQMQLIDDLLDVSRIVAGKLKVELLPVSLCAAVRTAIEGMSGALEKKSIKLEIALDESVGEVGGDSTRLQQVVTNLLTNAVKFTPAQGQVSITVDAANGQARIRVSDSGSGIDPGFLPRVFDRFSQQDSSNTRTQSGLGLGLAIVRNLVEQHGGTVQAESPGPGKGATFTVTLPLLASAKLTPEGEPLFVSAGLKSVKVPVDLRQIKELRVLVVDDDRATGEAVAEMLRDMGATVRVVESAGSAMSVLGEFHPKVLLCDVAMPEEDGYTFIRRLRRLEPRAGGGTLALALTALVSKDDQQEALAAGFQMHLAKPVDIDRLSEAVVALLASSDGERQS